MGALALLLCVLGGAAWMAHSSHRQREAQVQAQTQLLQCEVLVREKQLAQAYALAAEALDNAERSGDKELTARAHANLAELADNQGQWSEGSLHLRRALQIVKKGEELAAALEKLDTKRCQLASSLVQRARKAMLAEDYLKALQLSSAANYLLEEHRGKGLQRADCHFLSAQLYYRTGLRKESLAQLSQALAANPRHQGALALKSNLAPKPVRSTPSQVQVAAPNPTPFGGEEWVQPQLMPDPAYPVYQSKRKLERERDEPRRNESPPPRYETSPVHSYRPATSSYRPPKSTYKPPRRSTEFRSPRFEAPTFRSP
jgi:tetratricopeptide (TPR) repeat protein